MVDEGTEPPENFEEDIGREVDIEMCKEGLEELLKSGNKS
jgi:hypothetical protein